MITILESGQPRSFWGILAAVTLVGLAVPAAWLVPRFEKPPFDEASIPTRIFALDEDDCADWVGILRKAQDRWHKYRLHLLAPCIAIAVNQTLNMARDDELTTALDRDGPYPGSSQEFRLNGKRRFIVRINPKTVNRFTVHTEVGGHVLSGHTAVKVDASLERITDAYLHFLIDPYVLLGDYWAGYLLIVVAFAIGYRVLSGWTAPLLSRLRKRRE